MEEQCSTSRATERESSHACLDSLDFDDDGLIDIQDPGDILEFIFQMGAPPAEPFREPGLDPTPDDGIGCI